MDKCLFCGSRKATFSDFLGGITLVNCPCCGKYEFTSSFSLTKEQLYSKADKIAAFLFYNNFAYGNKASSRGYFFGIKEEYEAQGDIKFHYVTMEDIENWYPDSFSEKLNLMLLYFAEKTKVYGERIEIPFEAARSCMFVKRYKEDGTEMSRSECGEQIDFLTKYLEENDLLEGRRWGDHDSFVTVVSNKGWQRVDELQKDKSRVNQKNVFVAMAFKPGTEPVRDAIKKAIYECGYVPRIMDEIEHNHQIVPEMLYEIRQARFLIAELSEHNNGAYYEAGYALGLGKEVIHVCSKEAFESGYHFDVRQVNSVIWENVDELSSKLAKRIKATIG